MIRSTLMTISLALFWTLSPDALMMLSNAAGSSTLLFFVALVIGGGAMAATSGVLHRLRRHTGDHPYRPLTDIIGRFGSASLLLGCWFCLIIFLPAGMVVTAGFTFNETFLYWFPNFTFSSILLTSIYALHLAGERWALRVQPLFVMMAGGGLLLLVIVGISSGDAKTITDTTGNLQPGAGWSTLVIGFLLFLGHIEAPYCAMDRPIRISPTITIGTSLVLYLLWGLAIKLSVDGSLLAESTIATVIAAKQIWGQTGRIIMAIVTIAGTCALVNGLYLLAADAVDRSLDLLGVISPAGRRLRLRMAVTLFTVSIATALAAGLAGSEQLEQYISATLYFWLFFSGLATGATGLRLWRSRFAASRLSLLLGAMMVGVTMIGVTLHDQTILLLAIILSASCVGATLSGCAIAVSSFRKQPDR